MVSIRSEEVAQGFEDVLSIAHKRQEAMLEKLQLSLTSHDEKSARFFFEHLLEDSSILKKLKEVQDLLSQKRERGDISSYMVGSWSLYKCFHFLNQGADENINYVTGLQIGAVLTLDRLVSFELAESSQVYVRGDLGSSTDCLIQMEELGHKLHGWFHIHPGIGPDSTHPSQIDVNHQRKLEQGGYPAIGGIFSRDGFVRFFSLKRIFEISIYGKEVEKINDRVYHLTKVREIHHKRTIANRLTRGKRNR